MILFHASGQLHMSVNPTDKGLLTPDNCAVIFIDHQPQMFFGVASIDRQVLLNNLLVLAKAARIFGVPVILTAVESKGFKGDLIPELLELFPEEKPIERSTMNSWESADFVAAVKKTGRRNLVIAALWIEVCLAMPALQALTDGYFVFAVEDASGGMSLVSHHAALRRIEQAGAVSVTALQVLLEFQRDWARNEHYDEVMAALKAHCSIYGLGVENAITNVRQGAAGLHSAENRRLESQ
jgi:nicotinamidase-related amidase